MSPARIRAGLVLALLPVLGCSSLTSRADKSPAADEAALDEEISALSVSLLKKEGPTAQGVMPRDAHAKQHGCVRATFRVDDAVPEGLRAGVFAQRGKEYPAWIRFSNGGSKQQSDKKRDARGMAIKLMGVEGEKLLERERDARTQDFLMIDHDAFFVKDSKDYAALLRLLEKGSSPAWFFFGRLPWRWTEFSVARRMAKSGKKTPDPLFISYFSATPYSLGEKKVVKFSAQPCAAGPEARDHFPDSPDFLRLNMQKTLAAGEGKPACFRFMVQVRTDPETMPVEDPRIPWDQKKAKFIPIATITIPAQDFSTESRMRFCENLSFTPWHSLPAHRPLGGINRTRKAVYEAVSAFRHDFKHEARREPDADEEP